MPAWVRTEAERTSSECSASTPAVRDSTPRASGAATTTSSPSTSTATAPASASRRRRSSSGAAGGSSAPCSSRRVRATSSATSAAFQSLQTSGPVAWASAMVRACSRASSSAEPPTASATTASVGGSSRSRRVAVSGSSRCWRTSGDDGRRVAVRQPDPGGDRPGDAGADRGVVDAGRALADVVQQRAEQQQVRPGDASAQAGRAGRGLQQVPVDRVPVDGVVLGAEAHRVPLGQQPDQQADLVEGLQDGHRSVPGTEQRDELRQRRRRPRVRQRRRLPRQPLEGELRQRQLLLGGDPGGPQHQYWIGPGVGVPGEHHLAVLGDDAAGQPDPLRRARGPAEGAQAAAQQPADRRPRRLARCQPAQRAVEGQGQRPGRLVDVAEYRVTAVEAQCVGDPVLLLLAEDVVVAADAAVQLAADVQQDLSGAARRDGDVGELGERRAPGAPGRHGGRRGSPSAAARAGTPPRRRVARARVRARPAPAPAAGRPPATGRAPACAVPRTPRSPRRRAARRATRAAP